MPTTTLRPRASRTKTPVVAKLSIQMVCLARNENGGMVAMSGSSRVTRVMPAMIVIER